MFGSHFYSGQIGSVMNGITIFTKILYQKSRFFQGVGRQNQVTLVL